MKVNAILLIICVVLMCSSIGLYNKYFWLRKDKEDVERLWHEYAKENSSLRFAKDSLINRCDYINKIADSLVNDCIIKLSNSKNAVTTVGNANTVNIGN